MYLDSSTPSPGQAHTPPLVPLLQLPPRHQGGGGVGAVGLDLCSPRHHLCISGRFCPPTISCVNTEVQYTHSSPSKTVVYMFRDVRSVERRSVVSMRCCVVIILGRITGVALSFLHPDIVT